MVTQELLDYVTQQLHNGIPQDQLVQVLLNNGWTQQDVDEAMNRANIAIHSRQSILPDPLKNIFQRLNPTFIVLILTIIFLSMGGYFIYQKIFQKEETTSIPKEQPQQAMQPTPQATATVLDCKEDFKCFIQASAECKASKMVHTASADIFGVKQTTTSTYEIRGVDADKCLFYLRTDKIDMAFPDDISQEGANEQKEVTKKLEGREGMCKMVTYNMTAMLTRWEQGTFASSSVSCELTQNGNICTTKGGDFDGAECQGPYFENSL